MAEVRTHPDEGELIRYCDGELRAGDTARIARHLEVCGDCRTRTGDLRETVAEYVRYRRDVLDPALPEPPQPWRDLQAEFARMPARDPAWRRIFQRRAVWLVACTATAATGLWLYTVKAPKPQPATVVVERPAPLPVAPRPAPAAPVVRGRTAGPADELRAMAALHGIGADLGDPVEVVRTSKQIVVTCSGLSDARLSEVRHALAGITGVVVKLSPKPAAPPSGPPLEVLGAAHTNDNEQFVDGVLKHSEAMMARAHALRGLAMRFPADVEAALSADAQASLTGIRQEHQAALAQEVAALAAMLGPASPASAVHENWHAHALRLFAEAEQVDRLIGAKFAGHAASGGSDPSAELAGALAKLQADAN